MRGTVETVVRAEIAASDVSLKLKPKAKVLKKFGQRMSANLLKQIENERFV